MVVVSLGAVAQSEKNEKSVLEINQSSFRPVQTDALSGVAIDKIGLDRSKRPCARIKMRVNRMTREEIENITIKLPGGMIELMKRVVASEGNGLIFELTAKPNTRIYIHHDKYGDSNEVVVNLEGDKEYFLDAQLNLLLPIVVATNVKGADVYIDDEFKCVTGDNYMATVEDVTPGEHKITIKHGAAVAEQTVNVSSSSISFRVAVDDKASMPQYVVFELEPKHAAVFIDDVPQESKDGYMQKLFKNGTYNYRVMAQGYHEQSGTFTVSGDRVVKKVSLEENAATVTITSAEGAEIWVNDQKKGYTSWSGRLSAGTYIFEARKASHRTTRMSQNITSTPAEQSYTLDDPTPIVGTLTIASSPALANVLIDGVLVGETPIVVQPLVGHHTVQITKEGYVTWRNEITLTEDKTEVMEAELMKSSVPGARVSNSNSDASSSSNRPAPQSAPVTNFHGVEMIFVEGGTFMMGATPEQGTDPDSNEKPAHSVTLSSFYIAKYEVTQAQWQAIMGSNPSPAQDDNYPVCNVSWDDVQEFITKLNEQTGKKYRLPTEAEWEFAARGGNQCIMGAKFSGGHEIDKVAWYGGISGNQVHTVGGKRPNELGIYDMSGNVQEWVSDWCADYSRRSQTNPKGPSGGDYRVIRGGGWKSGRLNCRVSDRDFHLPSMRSDDFGFRLVLEP